MKQFYFLLLGLLCLQLPAAFAAAPTTGSSNLSFTNIEGNGFTLNFTKGNGQKRIIIGRKLLPVVSVPVNGTDYNHNTSFGAGDMLSEGEYVLYDGSNLPVSITGLSPNTIYHFAIYEYNGTGFTTEYLVSPATASKATIAPPATAASDIQFSELNGNSVKISWKNGDGARRLVLVREGGPVVVNPTDLVNYSTRTDFGTSTDLGNKTYAVGTFAGGATGSVTVKKLMPSQVYHVKVFEYNGSTGPVYQPANAPATSIVTLSRPTMPATGLTLTSNESNAIGLQWTSGNGTKRMVVATENMAHTMLPEDGMDFIHNTDFTKAPEIGPGHKVVYNGELTNVQVTGLKKGTQYHFRIYEYSGYDAFTGYLTDDVQTSIYSTLNTPQVSPSDLTFSSAAPASVKLTWKNGDGSGRMVLAKAGMQVDAMPQDLINYNANASFGSGPEIGNGNYVVYNGNASEAQVTKLTPGITYHYAVFEYNGNVGKVYQPSPARGSHTQTNRPTLPATSVRISLKDGDQFRVSWTSGNGEKRLVVMKKAQPITTLPADGVEYIAKTNFKEAIDIGPGEKVVYAGSGSTVDVTGLDAASTYFIRVYELAGSGSETRYLTTVFGEGTGSTLSAPLQQASQLEAVSISSKDVHFKWTAGNGSGRIMIMRKDQEVAAEPQDLKAYYPSAAFGGANAHLGDGQYVVSMTANNEASVNNLQPGATYHAVLYEFNGGNGKVFNRSNPARISFTTDTRPDINASAVKFSLVDGHAMRIQWNAGNGQNRIVVARKAAPIASMPVDGTGYAFSNDFSEAPELAAGEKIIANGNKTFVDITGLEHGTTYHFAIFEYSGSGSQIQYLTTQPARGINATLGIPVVPATNVIFNSVAATQLNIGWTEGDASNYLVIMRKAAAVNASPQQYKPYSSSTNYPSAFNMGDGNKVVSTTSGSTKTITGLESGTTYHVAIYGFNGNQGPAYLLSDPATGVVTTIGAPKEGSTNAMTDLQESTSFRLKWTAGSGQRRLVAMRKDAPVDKQPTDHFKYKANSFFGTGDTLSKDGEDQISNPAYIVYNGTGQEVIITNLEKDKVYHFAIWEFNDFGSQVMYQTIAPLRGEATASKPLPMTLRSFTARAAGTDANLEWTTTQEQNSKKFVIERSTNGGAFAEAGTVLASGNSNVAKHYRFRDPQLAVGHYAYRLRLADIDGSFTLSPVQAITISPLKGLRWYMSGGILVLQLEEYPQTPMVANIFSSDGKLLMSGRLTQMQHKLPLQHLTHGIYHLQVTDGKTVTAFKIIK